MSILEYNGAAILAMTGKNCVGICSDSRLGNQAQTVATDFEKIFKMGDKLMVGLPGLATDVITMKELLTFRLNLYRLREEREIKPETFSALMSHILYQKRFGPYFVEPIVAGLKEDNTPFISAFDLIGAPVVTDDFVVGGTCTNNLYGMCESFYRPDMDKDELFETMAQCLLTSVDRDALSGWGGVVHIITPEGIMSKTLKGRQD
ncbi:unnamed protein product [Ectocarpus sp. 6 AP-2014]|uniref:Proteasome subunit beta n=1 Tax=Ectocarpus siliculosus TaxID=2880 RepID=D7FY33_ECTSI|nr:conserved unknown protein [Ectocarpus siliculosus]|eukprot:CBJ32446.1 conserved unknown protein [Ectocarpus siliculosus]